MHCAACGIDSRRLSPTGSPHVVQRPKLPFSIRASAALMIFYGYDVLVRMMRLRPYDDPDRVALEKRLKAVFTAALA